MAKLIVGLGNPGREYEDTRHNIGWFVLDKIDRSLIWKEKFKGLFALANISGEQYIFLKPQTYMNLSGESVAQAAKFYKVDVKDIIVVHDELDLPYGTLALKKAGGLAGHNGLKSMAKCLGTQDFLRLRMGIGRPPHGNVSSWVLSRFSSEEEINLDDFVNLGVEAIEAFIKAGFEKSASKYSKKTVII